MDKRRLNHRLIVPIVLAVSLASTVAVLSSTVGCRQDKPRLDAGHGDGGIDTPIV